MRPFFITNANSASVRKRGSVLGAVGRDDDIPYIKTHDPAELQDVMLTAATQGVTWFCIEGGDGTVQATLSAYMRNRIAFETEPTFSLLPGGTTNQVSRHIGIIHSIESRLRELLARGRPEITPMPLLQVETGEQSDQFGFLFSSGAVPMATRYFLKNLHSEDKGVNAAVIKMIFKSFAPGQRRDIYHPTPLSLRITGELEEIYLDDDHLMTIVTTLPGLMLGLDPFWANGDAPLRLTYMRAGARHLLKNLLGVWAGRKNRDRSPDGFESWRAHVLKYDYDGPVMLDGDPVGAPDKTLRIRATEPLEFWT